MSVIVPFRPPTTTHKRPSCALPTCCQHELTEALTTMTLNLTELYRMDAHAATQTVALVNQLIDGVTAKVQKGSEQ